MIIVKNTGKLPDIAKAKIKTIYKITQNIRSKAVTNSPYKTGTLRRSILSDVQPELGQGKVWSNLPYARMREFGGVITPKKAKMLAWKSGGKWHFAKRVVQKWKPYLIPAYNSEIPKIGATLKSFIESTTK